MPRSLGSHVRRVASTSPRPTTKSACPHRAQAVMAWSQFRSKAPYLHDPAFAGASESAQNRRMGRWPSSNRHATLLDCSRRCNRWLSTSLDCSGSNRWHCTFHRWQTHGVNQSRGCWHPPLRHCIDCELMNCPPQFQKRCQDVIRVHNETFSIVAMRGGNSDRVRT